jgi:TetR/AcrR family transcriptional repressor of nem operon
MGRKKTYDRETIAEKAMELFWLHGFHGTSTEQLVAHMQVNRFSLYAEFGSKQALYEAALERYERTILTQHFAALEAPGAGFVELEALLGSFASAARTPGSEYGCFLCNSATERAPHDPASQRFFEAYVARVSHAFTHALSGAHRRKELRARVNLVDEAHFFATTLIGFQSLLRAQVAPEVIRGAAKVALAHLASLRRVR